MGFYGNITNTSRTQFQFDKIYPSRAEMDASTYTDGIYAGRYVLVEYDSDVHQSSFQRVFINDPDGQMYNAKDVTAANNKISIGENWGSNTVPPGAILFTADDDVITKKYINTVYYKVTGTSGLLKAGNYKQITADKTTSPDGIESTVSNYTKNYAIDNEKYGAGRGYDSTVWQKAYIDNVEKYIMIAELNSVVPTFGVSADAPTIKPIAPHFDTQSTDLYYKLHWQPAWGMRIAEGKPDTNKKQVTKSIDDNVGSYPTDEEVNYDNIIYKPESNTTEPEKISYNGAIYYNRAGFKDDIHTYYNGEFKTDKISVKPAGVSGMEYHKHGDSVETDTYPDIQEISIMLPSLGNALCDIWDKVYGYDPENDNLRYRDIGWKDAEDINVDFAGKPIPDKGIQGDGHLGGMTRNSETLAGCINMAHDLMGMIITTSIPNVLGEDEYQKHLIYYKDKKYYRIYKYPKYKVPDDINNATEVYLVDEELENDEWKVRKYNKRASVPEGKKLVIKDTADFGYKLVEIEDFARNLNTINGLIISIRNILESDNPETRNKKTVQGTINVLNDIIDCFNDLIPGEFLICNNDGKVNSAGWTTSQAIKYDNLGDGSSTEESEGENQWINLSINADAGKEKITLKHQLAHSQTNTITNSNKNNTQYGENSTSFNETDEITNKKLFSGINNDNKIDTLKLYTPIVDNAGHVVGKNTETVTLPYGYKYLNTSGRVDEEQRDLYTNIKKDPEGNIIGYEDKKKTVKDTEKNAQAENTQDQIIINPKNKWIQTQITTPDNGSDTITIAHEVHEITKTEVKTNNNGGDVLTTSQDNIVAYDVEVDAAGHVTKNQKHTYTLPYGYKVIKTSNDTASSTIQVPKELKTNDQTASNTQDTITIKGADSWIKVESKDKAISIYHNSSNPKDNTTTTSANTNITKKSVEENGVTIIVEENTPNFGSTFDIPQISYDKAGHIYKASSYSIKLPQPIISSESAEGNVMTDIDVDSSTGIFTRTKKNVGNLTLTGYSKGTDKEAIRDTDSINQAFGKLQTHIDDTNGLLNTEVTQIKAAINKEVTERETAITQEVTNRNTAITNAIKTLADYKGNTFSNSKTISSWEINDNGQAVIGVTDIQIATSQVTGLDDKLNNKAGKIELLGEKPNDMTESQPTLYSLLARITALEARVTALENSTGI